MLRARFSGGHLDHPTPHSPLPRGWQGKVAALLPIVATAGQIIGLSGSVLFTNQDHAFMHDLWIEEEH